MLEAITEFLRAIASLIPRLHVMSEKEGGVAWVRGKPRQLVSGGITFYWPVWTELEIISLKRATLNLDYQTVVMRGKKGEPITVTVSAVVSYEVANAFNAVTKLGDHDDVLGDLSLGAVRNALYGRSLDDILSDECDIEAEMKREISGSVRAFGIKVHRVFFSTVAVTRAYTLLGNSGQHIIEE